MNYLHKDGVASEVKKYKSISYIKTLPEGYDENKKYPVLLFLHGAGSRAESSEMKVKDNPFFEAMSKREKFPFIIIAPQCHADTWFDIFQELKELILSEANSPQADLNRVYAIGASMGGYGVWQAAMSLPDTFAAIVPICGGGMYWNAGRLKSVAVWAFHGRQDDCVLCRESEKMVDAVRKCGGEAKLTIYEDCEHASWNGAYAEPELLDWMLSHTKEKYERGDKLTGFQFG